MELKYLIREPQVIGENRQMLLLFHGYGSNEEDLFSFTPALPEKWIVVSFRAPLATPQNGFAWYDINLNNPEEFINKAQATESLNAILDSIIDLKKKYGIADGNIHIAGFSQGGILCYALALKNPQLFHKIALLSCYPEEKILTDIVREKRRLEHLRLFVSHGTDDAIIPLEWARKGADLLYDLSCYFTFREYMAGHGINQKNYLDLMEFLAK